MSFPSLLGAAGSGLALVAWFIRLERRDRREVIFGIIVAGLLLEALVNGSTGIVPTGVFRIPFPLGGGLRPPDVLISAALVARVTVSPVPKKVSSAGMLWTLFFFWYGAAMVMGLLRNHPTNTVLFQARPVLYIGGGLILAAGMRPTRLLRSAASRRWAIVIAAGATVALIAGFGGLTAEVHAPWLSMRLGGVPVDGALVAVVVGMILLVVETSRDRRSPWLALFALGMLATPFSARQAGNFVATAVMLIGLGVVTATPTWRRRVRVRPTEVALFMGVLAMALAPVLADEETRPFDPLAQLDQTFFSQTQENTTQDRFDLWGQAVDVIKEQPIMGSGLGVEQQRSARKSDSPVDTASVSAHNVGVDVTVRAGAVGLLLLVFAVSASVRSGWRVWREHWDDRVAALALGCLLGVAAFVSKAMVGSSFENFRFATLFGLLLGTIAATDASLTKGRSSDDAEPALADLSAEARAITTTIPETHRP